MDLPWRLVVNDATIVDDTLYFCGHYVDTRTPGGLLGCVSLAGFNASATPRVDYVVETSVHSLEKIVVNRPFGTQVGIMAVGKKAPTSWPNDVLVQGADLTAITVNLSVFQFPANEVMEDILLVGETVVTVGRIGSNLCMRKFQVNHSFPPIITFFTRYLYPLAADEVNGLFYGASVNGSTLALSYVHVDATDSAWARVRRFNVDTMANTTSFEFRVTSKDEPLNLVKLSRSMSLVLLQPYVDGNGEERTDVYRIPQPLDTANPVCSRYRHPQRWYSSAACVYNRFPPVGGFQEVLLLNGGDRWYWQNNYVLPGGNSTAFLCVYSTTQQVGFIPNLTKNVMSNRIMSNNSSSNSRSAYCSWSTMTPTVGCYSFQ